MSEKDRNVVSVLVGLFIKVSCTKNMLETEMGQMFELQIWTN